MNRNRLKNTPVCTGRVNKILFVSFCDKQNYRPLLRETIT